MEERMKIRNIVVTACLIAGLLTVNTAWAGKIVIKGSTTVLPVAQKVAEAYMKQNPDIKISISGGGSSNGGSSHFPGNISTGFRFRGVLVSHG
jgi:phosphate transport system substrate-binding protein